MSKPEADKRKPGGVQVAQSPASDPQPESLDKVRDILFGGQMRAVESRLQGMEERLRQEHDALRSEFGRQAESLDALIRAEVQSLSERLTAERAKRTEELKSLAAEIKEAIRAIEKQHVKAEEAANMADAALRDQLFLQSAEASAALTNLGERLTAELSRSHHELQSTKTDRATLAALFTDVASRLGGVPGAAAAPGKNGPRG
jgi:hypothetical protein